MRTRLAAVAAAMASLALASCAAAPAPTGAATSPPPGTVTPTASVAPSGSDSAAAGNCTALAAGLTPERAAGQLFMVGVVDDLDAAERALLVRYSPGSVILMGQPGSPDAVKATTAEIARAGGDVPILVATDQEGGLVQRLKAPGFERIPSALDQGRMSDAELTAAATRWGKQLSDAGVRYALTPVADVVPASKRVSNEPIGKLRRGFGSDPDAVAAKVAASVKGWRAGGVATSVKHFPNLGEVTGNTDFAAGVTDGVTTLDSPALKAFKAGVDAGSQTVMVSTAIYRRIDPDAPAAFSAKVIDGLRDRLSFEGVVISDDLGAAAAVKAVPAGQRGVRFVRAGGDLAITVDPALLGAMVDGVVDAARSDAAFASRVRQSATRVLELKADLGLVSCTPVR